jgi:hypothetical protein
MIYLTFLVSEKERRIQRMRENTYKAGGLYIFGVEI